MQHRHLLWSSLLLLSASWAQATVPAGYYAPAEGKQDEALKTALHDIIAPHTRISYGSAGSWVVFRTSDVRPDGSIWDVYSDVVRYFPETGSHPEMNIEHSVPKSWWGDVSPFIYDASYDMHHLLPADARANIAKSNHMPGKVEEATFDNGVFRVGRATVNGATATVFEPADEYKGDFARMYMYVATCYQDYTWMSAGTAIFADNLYPTFTPYATELLMSWHRADPVSQKETDRNEAVFAAQQNRNPFIDYPQLAEYLWGDSTGCAFYSGAAGEPYITQPARGSQVNMGTVMQGGTLTYELMVQAHNLTSPLQLSWRVGAGISAGRTTIAPAEADAGVQIALSYTNTALQGALVDTLVIDGGGLYRALTIPVTVQGTSQFVVLPATDVDAVGAALHWVTYPDATEYEVRLYEGASCATDLFISAYVEGSSYNKALALYNGTDAAIDLSDYGIARQHNGAGNFVDYMDLPAATLPPGDTYILVHSQCGNDDLMSLADQTVAASENSPLNFNGNDAVALYHRHVLIDVVGYEGVATYWGQDVTLYRKHTVVGPTVDFDFAQWTQAPTDDFAALRSHTMEGLVSAPIHIGTYRVSGVTYIVEDLTPLTTYTYAVTAHSGNTVCEALYRGIFTTTSLPAPQLRQPDDITATGFTARWEAVDGARTYEVECFTLQGSGWTEVSEGFDEVGSNGTPLPDGWSGTASGNYTTATSSGASAPSVALKNSGEYIETPRYDAAVTALSFMYRFASTGTGSYLTVERLSNDEWSTLATLNYENTTKHTMDYTFDAADDVRAFRFTYHKERGNLAIDDVVVTYGAYDTVAVEEPRYVSDTQTRYENLDTEQTYYYRVRAMLGEYVSPWSAVAVVEPDPNSNNGEPLTGRDLPTCTLTGARLTVSNIEGDAQLALYDLQGVCRAMARAQQGRAQLTLPARGIYLLQVTLPMVSHTLKIAY